MEKQLYHAALEGNKISLLNLLKQDPSLLDRFVTGRYLETPLHIATMHGHSEFVDELLTRKPELAQELNSRKSSPLHLATAKASLQIVKMLLQVNPDMCHACDLDGRNPLHIAAMKGHLDVLKELVDAKPWAARSLMEDGETILHACVRYKQLEVLKFLVEGVLSDPGFVNCQNRDGNTILHLAVAAKQKKAMRFLKSSKTVDVKCLNKEGFTARKLLPHNRREKLLNWLTKRKGKGGWVEKKREALMVVASLLAAMAFQAGINPPRGVWQDDKDGHVAGLSILADKDERIYTRFLIFNTTGFLASLSIIMLLVSGLPLKNRFFMWILMVILWVAITAMAFAYLLSLIALTPADVFDKMILIMGCASLVWALIMVLLIFGHTLRLIKISIGLIIRLIMCLLTLVSRLTKAFSTKEGKSVPVETSRSSIKPETLGSNQV